MNLKSYYFLFLLIVFQLSLFAQKPLKVKFGEIKVEDFSPISPAIDSSANAVVLADIGSTDFEGNNKGFFTLDFKQHERILLKNRNAFDDATVKVILRSGDSQNTEDFLDFEAATYNLENGKVVETKMDKGSIFKEKYNKDYIALKFTLPNLKPGSIIEYKYRIKSPFNNNDIRSWSFQREYPVLWSEYKVSIPPFLNYAKVRHGFLPYAIDSAWLVFKSYSIISPGDATSSSTVYNLSGNSTVGWWAVKDAPAFKKQSYMTSSKNYISRITFQLLSIKYDDYHIKLIVKDWFATSDELQKDPDFGKELTENNSWMSDDLKTIAAGSHGLEKAKKIYGYLRDNFTCIDDDARELSQPLKKTFQTKKGNVADINLLLTAMLIHEGFDAHPMLLSTRDNGTPSEISAFLYQYNYVLCRVILDTVDYLLDASRNRLGFGKLTENVYNGSARLIDKTPILVQLSPDSLVESKYSSVFLSNNDKGDSLVGAFNSQLGYFESLHLRDRLANTKQEEVFKEIAKQYPSEIILSDFELDSVKAYDMPVTEKYGMSVKFDEDIVYFNPMFAEAYKNNPFASEKRIYPVEMLAQTDELYTLNMEVPKGYKVDELPKSVRINLNGNEGMFEYLVANNNDVVQLRTRLVLRKATYEPEDYQTLRDFFGQVVKKQAEQIVFKKIK